MQKSCQKKKSFKSDMTISKRSDKAGETARSGDTTIDQSQDLINHAIEKWRQRHASAVKWGDRGCHSTV